MSNFYLHTLEGVARTFGAAVSLIEEFDNFFYKHRNNGYAIGESIFKALQNLHALHPLDDLNEVYEHVYSFEGKNNMTGYIEVVNNFISWLSRVKQQAQAQQGASAQAAAYKAAMDRKKQEEEDAAAIEAEERRIIAAQRAADEASEQAAAYREAMSQQAVIYPEIVEEKREVEQMTEQQIDLNTQLITSGSEYTVVDETPYTISYVDETGKLYVEEKPRSGWGWLLAAAAAFFFLG